MDTLSNVTSINEVEVMDSDVPKVVLPTSALPITGGELGQRFNAFSKKSVEAIIEMGKIVLAADDLSKIERDRFYGCIRYSESSKASLKFGKIGEKASLLLQYVDDLPNSWTTLYQLARLDSSDFAAFAEKGDINKWMTGAAAEALVTKANGGQGSGPKQNQKPTVVEPAETVVEINLPNNSYGIAMQFESIPSTDELSDLNNFIVDCKARFKCNFLMTSILEQLIAQASQTAEVGVQ